MNQSDLNEMALQVALTVFDEHPYDKGHVVSPSGYTWIDDKLIEFAEALIAEIAKGNEPCAFLHEWIEYHPFGDTFAGEPCAAITNDEKPFDSSDTVSPLFTFPPTAEQIANETAWQPIETAPKDEDLIVTDGNNVALGRWVGRYFAWGYGADPTHWMPLPTPPKRSMEGV